MQTRVEFTTVSKSYRLGQSRSSLREALYSLGRRLVTNNQRESAELFWALNNVSLKVSEGEVVGLIGPNGAGKTTILKLISNITVPTYGAVEVHGVVSALLELGAGFHPELTGRENIYLNAAILGTPMQEVRKRFDEIVWFSGLENFLDTPVKRYSSGMYVRLAFAVAAHTRADVVLVDEVLAVGDAPFRQRCLERMRQLKRDGATVLFVSHNLYLVESVCDRCLFLANGTIQNHGDVSEVLNSYERWRQLQELESGDEIQVLNCHEEKSSLVRLSRIEITGGNKCGQGVLAYDLPTDILLHYVAGREIRNPAVCIKVLGRGGTCCMIRTLDYGIALDNLFGRGVVRVSLKSLQLTPGAYSIHAEILEGTDCVVLAEGFSTTFSVDGNEVGHEGVFVPNVVSAQVEKEVVSSQDEKDHSAIEVRTRIAER